MESFSLSVIMDFVLLGILCLAIYYMMRVTRALSAFRSNRQDFLRLMGELSNNIDKAQATIETMKNTGRGEGAYLQEQIDQARLAADELQLINETGNNLAKRLETLAEKNSQLAQGKKKPVNGNNVRNKDEFFIHDREYNDAEENIPANTPDWAMDEAGVPEGLQSKAEKELFQALQRNRNSN